MNIDDEIKTGTSTSEWKGAIVAMVVNVVIGLFAGQLEQWGITIDPEALIAAIAGNSLIAGTYAVGRSHIKAKAVEAER